MSKPSVSIRSRRPSKYKAVFFDAGGTLFRVYPSVGHIYSRIAKKYGARISPKVINRDFEKEFNRRNRTASLNVHVTEKSEKLWWKTIVHDIFSRHTKIKRFDHFFDELYHLFAMPDIWCLYPEVTNVLKKLQKQGMTLDIISNWDSRLITLIKSLKLEKYFDFVLASAIVGSAKPDRGIFEEALKRAGTLPGQALHIGDRYGDDYLGAQEAGIRPILIHREGSGPRNTHIVRSLNQILPIVGIED